MALISNTASAAPKQANKETSKKAFANSQKLSKIKALEKKAKKKKISMDVLCMFTQQLSSMLEAGLPLVSCLEALQEQTEDPVFAIIIRDVRNDISGGTAFSEATGKFRNAFPNLFISMVEAGEASGGLASIMGKVADYFEDTVKLSKKVKGAMTYPAVVIGMAVLLVNVLLIFVIPVFDEMFTSMGAELPKPTQMLIDLSKFLGSYWWALIIGGFLFFKGLGKFCSTPKGRVIKDQTLFKLPVVGALTQKVALSRFCRTYAILLRSGVPILRSLEIVSNASDNTFIEDSCTEITRQISQGGQLSDVVATQMYFPPLVKHMSRAGEQTGNVDGMMDKVADFYDAEIETIVESLTSLMEPLLICFLGVVIGGIVMAMFMPIFNLANVVGGQ